MRRPVVRLSAVFVPLMAVAASGCGLDITALAVTITGTVQDYSMSLPIEGAEVVLYDQTGAYLGEALTDDSGEYKISTGAPYTEADGLLVHGTVQAPGMVNTDFYQQVYVRNPSAAALILRPANEVVPESMALPVVNLVPHSSRSGTISGRVFDALSSDQAVGLGGITLLLRRGINPPDTEPVVASTIASGNGPTEDEETGNYQFKELDAGTYTVSIAGNDEYLGASFTVSVIGGSDTVDRNAGTTTLIAEDAARAVLTWGDSPTDLDTHVTGDTDLTLAEQVVAGDADTRWHVYFESPEYPIEGGPEGALAFLDVDDVDGYGPETVTFNNLQEGLYRYSVHDYSTRGDPETAVMSFSGAKVQLWIGTDNYVAYDIPVNTPGTVWTVFEIDGDTKHWFSVNSFNFQDDPSVGSAF